MKGFSIYVIACIIVVAGPLLARSDDDHERHGYGHKKHGQCESLVLDWSDWGPCSVPCEGVGLQIRARQMVQSQSCDSQEVPCPIPGTWSTWADVGGCSVTCGSGEQAQTRECVGAENGGTCIDEDDNPALEDCKTVSCDEDPCPTATGWDSWTNVGGCSVSCGSGEQVQSRQCTVVGGTCLDQVDNPAVEDWTTVTCDEPACPDASWWDDWADVSGCSVTCGSGEQVQKRECVGAPTGATCIDEDDNPALEEWKTVTCDEDPCPSATGWDSWTNVGGCSVSCGSGEQVQSRQCTVVGGTCLDQVDNPAVEDWTTVTCDEPACPDASWWDDWADVSGCSVTCGSGEQVQKRECVGAPVGATCIDEDDNPALEEWKTVTCDEDPCPSATGWDSWTNVGGCSVSCGSGEQVQSRQCTVVGGTCLDQVDNPAVEDWTTVTCDEPACPVDGAWGDWTVQSDCDATACGGEGEQDEQRTCNGRQNGGNPCVDTDGNQATTETRTVTCTADPCPTWCKYLGYRIRSGEPLDFVFTIIEGPSTTLECRTHCWNDPACKGSFWRSNICYHYKGSSAVLDVVSSTGSSPNFNVFVKLSELTLEADGSCPDAAEFIVDS